MNKEKNLFFERPANNPDVGAVYDEKGNKHEFRRSTVDRSQLPEGLGNVEVSVDSGKIKTHSTKTLTEKAELKNQADALNELLK